MREPLKIKIPSMPPRRTAQHKGVFVPDGRPVFYKKSGILAEERNMVALLCAHLPEGWVPFAGPVAASIHLCYPYRKAEKRRVVASGAEIPCDTRPDLDNLAKGILDAMSAARVWGDDGQVARLTLEKVWGPSAYWSAEVAELAMAALPDEDGGGNAQMALALEGGAA